MKTKNLILGICSLALAIGSAFTFPNEALISYYIRVTYNDMPGGTNCPHGATIVCEEIYTSSACDVGAGTDCVVTVASFTNRKVQNFACNSVFQSTGFPASATIVNADYHASCISSIE